MSISKTGTAVVLSAMLMISSTSVKADTLIALSDEDLDRVTAGAEPISITFAAAVLYSVLKFKAVQVAAPVIVSLSSVPPEVIADVAEGVGSFLVEKIIGENSAEPTFSPPSSVTGFYINLADYLLQRGSSQPETVDTPARETPPVRVRFGES